MLVASMQVAGMPMDGTLDMVDTMDIMVVITHLVLGMLAAVMFTADVGMQVVSTTIRKALRRSRQHHPPKM